MKNIDEAFASEQNKAEQFWKDMYCNDRIAKADIDMNKVGFVTPYLDDVKGKNVLDVGCGRGDLSVILATHGAHVTAFDMIQGAVDATNSFADANKAEIESAGGSINALCMNASDIDMFDKDSFDYAFGSMILHHIEPLDDFADKLAKIVKMGGVLVFNENSSANGLLMFIRKHIVGRFGIPRYGDGVEVPVTKKEIEMLKEHFHVEIQIYQLVFFRLLGRHIFGNNKMIVKFLSGVDNFCYKYLPFTRKWSYHRLFIMRRV